MDQPKEEGQRIEGGRAYAGRAMVAIAAAVFLVGTGAGMAGEAPSGEQDSEGLQEIVVSANRREESLQKVGTSVAAETGQRLEELSIQRPEDLVRLVPGLGAIPNAGSAASSFAIRGVGQSDFTEHEEQPVAVYQDGVYIALSSATGFPIFDVQRVEVERGPQGTLFGRNATGGLIQFFSNKPTEALESGVELTTGDRNLRRVEGFVSGGTDVIAGRFAVYHSEQDGFIKNLNGPNLLGAEVNAGRAQFDFKPDSATKVNLRLEAWRQDGRSLGGKNQPSYIDANGYPQPLPANVNQFGKGPGLDLYGFRDNPNPLVVSVNDPGEIYKQSETAALTASHDFDAVTLISTTAFTNSHVRYREDSDSTLGNVENYADGGNENTLSQELRLQGAGEQYRWTGGLSAISIHGTFFTYTAFPTLCDTLVTTYCSTSYTGSAVLNRFTGEGAFTTLQYGLSTHTTAAFSQGEYDITDKLTVTLGARYTHDAQKFNYAFQCTEDLPLGCNAIFGTPLGVLSIGPVGASQAYNPWSGKAALNYKLEEDILLYLSTTRGAKSGGYFSDQAGATPVDLLSFKPEKLNAYETGVKSRFLDRRLTINADAFYYDYKDFQTFSFNGVSTSVLNKPAYAKGGELEVTAEPGFGIVGNLGVAYDDMKVLNVTTPLGLQTENAINAPTWQINWGARKSFPIVEDMKLTVAYDGRYTSDRYWNIVNSNTTHTPGFTLHDANARVDKGNVFLNAYCTNFTNHIYTNIAFDQSFQGFYLSHIGEPRTFGLTAGARFQ